MANRKNYSKISTDGAKSKQTEETKIESTLNVDVTKKVENESQPKVAKGVVVGCEKLNVRMNPSLDAVVDVVIDKGTEVEITGSHDNFYRVRKGTTTEGFDGWCMKNYISVTE